MDRDFDLLLDECLDRLNGGQSVEECLALYPQFAEEIEPLLMAAAAVHAGSASVGGDEVKAKGRARLQQAEREFADGGEKSGEASLRPLFRKPRLWVPLSAAIVVILIIIGLASLASFNRSSDGTSSPLPVIAKTGTLELRVTDAPRHDISAVNVTVSDIKVHREGADWQTVIGGSRSFELLELRGVEEILGSRELEAGRYTQIRFDVEKVLVEVDGFTREATLPGEQLKLAGTFDIHEGKVTILTLDFDAEKSVAITGNDMIIFKPVVKIMVTND